MLTRPKTPGSGRKPGSLNKRTQNLQSLLQALKVPPHVVLAQIMSNDLDCGACRGTGKTKFQAGGDKPGVRVCQSCWGSGKERVTTDQRERAASSLMKYAFPQLKAIEHSGDSQEAVEHRVRVTYVDAEFRAIPPGRSDAND